MPAAGVAPAVIVAPVAAAVVAPAVLVAPVAAPSTAGRGRRNVAAVVGVVAPAAVVASSAPPRRSRGNSAAVASVAAAAVAAQVALDAETARIAAELLATAEAARVAAQLLVDAEAARAAAAAAALGVAEAARLAANVESVRLANLAATDAANVAARRVAMYQVALANPSAPAADLATRTASVEELRLLALSPVVEMFERRTILAFPPTREHPALGIHMGSFPVEPVPKMVYVPEDADTFDLAELEKRNDIVACWATDASHALNAPRKADMRKDNGGPPCENAVFQASEPTPLAALLIEIARGRSVIGLLACFTGFVLGRMCMLFDALPEMRRTMWRTHDYVFHHVFAISFDRDNNAELTYVTLMPPHIVTGDYVENEVANLVTFFRPARGMKWYLNMKDFQELEFLIPSEDMGHRTNLDAMAVRLVPALSTVLGKVQGVVNGKLEFSSEGNRLLLKFLGPADRVTQADITLWRPASRMFGTDCYRVLRLNPNAIGFVSFAELLEVIKDMGSRSYESLLRTPALLHFFGLNTCQLAGLRITRDPTMMTNFFSGKCELHDLRPMGWHCFIPATHTFNYKASLHDLTTGMCNAELMFARYCGGQWRNTLVPIASEIQVHPRFVSVKNWVVCFAAHRGLYNFYHVMKSDNQTFNWTSDLTAPAYLVSCVTEALTDAALAIEDRQYDPRTAEDVRYPAGSIAGLHVPAGNGDRPSPLIGSKNRPAGGNDDIEREPKKPKVEPDSDKKDKKPKKDPKENKDPPLPPNNENAFCYADVIKKFNLDVAANRYSACSDPANGTRCRRGRHLSLAEMPPIGEVVSQLERTRGAFASLLVELLNKKKDE